MNATVASHGADRVIRGGTVVRASGRIRADVVIKNGRITAIGPAPNSGLPEIDARGLLVMPGAVDIHTHIDTEARPGVRSADDWYSGTVAAACGGVTTVVDYARQTEGEDLLATMARWRERAAGRAVIDYGFHVVPMDFGDRVLSQLPGLVAAGYPGVKIFMSRVSDEDMTRAMYVLARCGGTAMVHCEDLMLREQAYARLRTEGRATARAWPEARPREGERVAAARAVEHCARTGCSTYLVHLSCRESVAIAREGKARGLPLRAETRPCYLLLTEERYADAAPWYLCFTGYPPLRTADDVEAVWDGIVDGTIDTVGSDHLSWTLAQKEAGDRDLDALLVGLPALETEVRAIFSAGVSTERISAERFVAIMSTTPAQLAGLYPAKGALEPGSDGDIVLVDPTRTGTIHGTDMHGGAGHEPLEGLSCVGWPVMTISRGEIVAADSQPLGDAGRGLHLRRHGYHRPR